MERRVEKSADSSTAAASSSTNSLSRLFTYSRASTGTDVELANAGDSFSSLQAIYRVSFVKPNLGMSCKAFSMMTMTWKTKIESIVLEVKCQGNARRMLIESGCHFWQS